MRIFHFRCLSYGAEASILAESEEKARAILLATRHSAAALKRMDKTNRMMAEFTNCHIDNMLAGNDYEIIAIGPGEVLWTERS